MWLAILITVVAATGNSIGKALQKQATKSLPRFTIERKVISLHLSNKEWLIGVAADLVGGLTMIAAYALAPVSIVQPVSSTGLVSLAVFSHFYLQERLHKREWLAVAVTAIGTLGLGSEQTKQNDAPVKLYWLLVVFGAMLVCIAAAVVLSHHKAVGPKAGSRVSASVYGLEAGGCFGMSGASCRVGMMLAKNGVAWLAAGIIGSVCLTSTGFVLQARGFKDGNTVIVCTCSAVTAMISSVILGVIGLGEELPSTSFGLAVRLSSWAMILLGVWMISQGPEAYNMFLAVLGSILPRRLLALMPTDVAIKLRQSAHKLDLPVKNHHKAEAPPKMQVVAAK